ncbi:MAG TPA: TetR/AcrR family transcriptional regulator [Pseudolabrys sp.]|nr:TetR/AcrR family transcriptional regulator [Pseudolabrys sp.]
MKRRRARHRQKGASWQRDPEGMRARILGAATKEFARYGFGGARLNRIAKTAGANKRMIYYHVGDKEALYLAVLEGAYDHIRTAERRLNLEELGAGQAIVKLLTFTWQYFLENPEFMALLNEENQHRARHLRHSRKVKGLHSPFVELIADILRRGEASGELRKGIDPVQFYISLAALSYFYQSNSATLSVIFGRDLLSEDARAERLAHMTDLVLAALRPAATETLDPELLTPIEFNQRVKI